MRRYDNKNSQEHTKTASEQSKQPSIEHKQVEEEPRGIEDYLDNNNIIERKGYNMLPNALHTSHTILVLEDDERLSRPTQKNLTRSGFHTALVSSGAEAIAWIANNPVALLLMNYRLPDMSAKKFLHTLTDRNLSVPFITMIEQGDEKAAIEMMKLGARDYLVKDAEFLDMLPSVVNRAAEQLEIESRLHEAEEALKKSEERYHALFEIANVGIIVSVNAKIAQVNSKAEEIYGYSKAELIGQAPRILTPEKYRKRHIEMLDEILNSEEMKKTIFEEEGVKKDGSLFPIEISFTITGQEENMVIAVIRDITARKEMEHKLLQSKKLKSLGELAGGVAHDFNNVLAAILGRVQLARMILKDPQGEQERRKSVAELNKSLEVIEKTSLDGAETVRRILEFSRKREDDKYFTEVDLNKIIEDALEFTKVRWKEQAEANGIKFKIKKDLSPLVSIAGSTSDLREVFINIFNNAIDAMSQGGNITIQTLQENSHITAYVKDSGIGIPEPIRDMIFDPFFTTKGVESTGLGLSVSYGIITRHRGTITVDRTEGQGTTFSIRLPLSENIIKENKPQPISRTQRKARILVIEDEKEVRELLYDILTGEGHEVETAPNGREGMKIFKKGEFDLIFTDLGMPGMTGLQVAEAIKKTNTKTPVILITGWELQLKDSELKKSGINLVVNKPFKVEQVLRLVQECEKKAISKAKSKK